jgi:hypothetical protein
MGVGEFAVHYSKFYAGAATPFCTVLPSVEEAEAFARAEVQRHPELRCTIYDHNGFVGAPLRDVRGVDYKEWGEITQRFRRWVGGVLFFGGVGLTIFDWQADFRYLWPSMLGTRMLIPGTLLLFTEAMILLQAWHTKRRAL